MVLFFACLTVMRWPPAVAPLLPTKSQLVPLPSPRGEFVSLDTPSRRLVVSPTPLPHRPPKARRPRPNQLRRLLAAYRPLRVVHETDESPV